MRLLAALTPCALFASLPTTTAAPVPTHLMKSPPAYYFPTAVGTRLVYEEAGRERVVVVTAVTDRGGAKLVSASCLAADGNLRPLWALAVSGAGVAELDHSGSKAQVREWWLRLPAEPGECWATPGNRPTVSTVLAAEDVTVPAGTFRAIPVRATEGGKTTYWYAPGVGLVKASGDWEVVLKSCAPGPG